MNKHYSIVSKVAVRTKRSKKRCRFRRYARVPTRPSDTGCGWQAPEVDPVSPLIATNTDGIYSKDNPFLPNPDLSTVYGDFTISVLLWLRSNWLIAGPL